MLSGGGGAEAGTTVATDGPELRADTGYDPAGESLLLRTLEREAVRAKGMRPLSCLPPAPDDGALDTLNVSDGLVAPVTARCAKRTRDRAMNRPAGGSWAFGNRDGQPSRLGRGASHNRNVRLGVTMSASQVDCSTPLRNEPGTARRRPGGCPRQSAPPRRRERSMLRKEEARYVRSDIPPPTKEDKWMPVAAYRTPTRQDARLTGRTPALQITCIRSACLDHLGGSNEYTAGNSRGPGLCEASPGPA